MKQLYIRILILLSLLFAVEAVPAFGQQDDKAQEKTRKQELREEKQARRQEKKQLQQQISRYQYLRDEAAIEFAKKHQPTSVMSPFAADFTISNIICGGDTETGTVMLYFTVTSKRIDGYRLLLGGSHSGTRAFADGEIYDSASIYGHAYTIRTGMPEQIVITLNQVDTSIKKFAQFDIGIGIRENVMNIITMHEVPIFWTSSNRTIRDYVRSEDVDKN